MSPAPSDRQIAHRDFVTGTELREFLDRFQTLRRLFAQLLVRRYKQIAVRQFFPSANTAANLIQLGQTETVCVLR